MAQGTLPGRGAIREDFLEKVLSKQTPGGMCQAQGRVQGSRWRGTGRSWAGLGQGRMLWERTGGRGWGNWAKQLGVRRV